MPIFLEAAHPVEELCADVEFWQRNGLLSSDGQADATNEISTVLSLDGSCLSPSQRRKMKKKKKKYIVKSFKDLSGNKDKKDEDRWNESRKGRRKYVDE